MENGSWIKLFTKIKNWHWYKDKNVFRLFIHCLLSANWKDSRFEDKVIKRGSFVTSLQNISQETGLTIQQTRTALNKLKSTNEITYKSTNKYTVISIVNYNLYQVNNKQNNKQITTIEEYKNNNMCIYNRARTRERGFLCHLGATSKNESCLKCQKRNICSLPTSEDFKFNHSGQALEEYERNKEKALKEINEHQTDKKELIDYNWLDEV